MSYSQILQQILHMMNCVVDGLMASILRPLGLHITTKGFYLYNSMYFFNLGLIISQKFKQSPSQLGRSVKWPYTTHVSLLFVGEVRKPYA